LRAQATETGSEAISRQFAGGAGGAGDPDLREMFDKVAGFLVEMREDARQYLGDLAFALGRAFRLPDWAAVAMERLVVAAAPLPLDLQLLVGAAAIRVAGAFFEVQIGAHEARGESIATPDEALARLAADLGAIFAPFAAVPVHDVRLVAEITRAEPPSLVHPVVELVGAVEAQALEHVAELEHELVERAARAEAEARAEVSRIVESPAVDETVDIAPGVRPEVRPEVRMAPEVQPPAPHINVAPW
jgi:hypothetical protein